MQFRGEKPNVFAVSVRVAPKLGQNQIVGFWEQQFELFEPPRINLGEPIVVAFEIESTCHFWRYMRCLR